MNTTRNTTSLPSSLGELLDSAVVEDPKKQDDLGSGPKAGMLFSLGETLFPLAAGMIRLVWSISSGEQRADQRTSQAATKNSIQKCYSLQERQQIRGMIRENYAGDAEVLERFDQLKPVSSQTSSSFLSRIKRAFFKQKDVSAPCSTQESTPLGRQDLEDFLSSKDQKKALLTQVESALSDLYKLRGNDELAGDEKNAVNTINKLLGQENPTVSDIAVVHRSALVLFEKVRSLQTDLKHYATLSSLLRSNHDPDLENAVLVCHPEEEQDDLERVSSKSTATLDMKKDLVFDITAEEPSLPREPEQTPEGFLKSYHSTYKETALEAEKIKELMIQYYGLDDVDINEVKLTDTTMLKAFDLYFEKGKVYRRPLNEKNLKKFLNGYQSVSRNGVGVSAPKEESNEGAKQQVRTLIKNYFYVENTSDKRMKTETEKMLQRFDAHFSQGLLNSIPLTRKNILSFLNQPVQQACIRGDLEFVKGGINTTLRNLLAKDPKSSGDVDILNSCSLIRNDISRLLNKKDISFEELEKISMQHEAISAEVDDNNFFHLTESA